MGSILPPVALEGAAFGPKTKRKMHHDRRIKVKRKGTQIFGGEFKIQAKRAFPLGRRSELEWIETKNEGRRLS